MLSSCRVAAQTAIRPFPMKNNQPNDDQALRAALRGWNVNAPLPPRFQEQVWNRIEKTSIASQVSIGAFLGRWLEAIFVRPAFATAYIAILLFGGAATAVIQSRETQAHMDKELSAQYVQAVDPYQKVASNR